MNSKKSRRDRTFACFDPKVEEAVKEVANSTSLNYRIVRRAKGILGKFEGKTNKEIGQIVGVAENTVSIWKIHFLEAKETLNLTAATAPSKVKNKVIEILSDKEPNGHRIYTESQREAIKELAFGDPKDYGYDAEYMTFNLLQSIMADLEIAGEDISLSTVWRILDDDGIRLGRQGGAYYKSQDDKCSGGKSKEKQDGEKD